MSRENVEIVRRLLEQNRSGHLEETLEQVLEFAHPEIEFNSRLSTVEGASYRGHDGMRRYQADMSDAWREWRIEVEEIEDLGSARIYAQVTMHAVGHSGVTIDLRSWMIVEVAEEKVRRMAVYASREEALAAVGGAD